MAILLALSACGGSPPTDSPSFEGARLVAGTSLPRHGLLVVPRTGGPAELRALEDPDRVRWTGQRALPPSTEAFAIGRSVVLRGEDGVGYRFEPSGEVLTPLGDLPADARWISDRHGGAWVFGDGALVVGSETARRIDAGRAVLWAAPASEGRHVLLTEGDGQVRLEVWEAGSEEPDAVRGVDSRGPALIAAWGREVVLPGAEGRTLIGYAIPSLEPSERARVPAPPVTLALSPSEHRVFAAGGGGDDRSQLLTIERYGWETLRRTRTEAAVRQVRPAPTGDAVLAFDGSDAWMVRSGEDAKIRVASEWRPDLPIGLPGGEVLGVADGAVVRFGLEGERIAEVEGPTDAWWLPIRWRPRRIETVVPSPEVPETGDDPAAGAPARHPRVGLTTTGDVTGRTVVTVPGTEMDRSPREREAAAPSVPTPPRGFYAVATSSRQLASLRTLRRSLEGSGYDTQVLPRLDEAGELWYRLLVGPYPSRDAAESAADRLQRERGISAWIHEIDARAGGGE